MMKILSSVHFILLLMAIEINYGVIYLKRQRRKSEVEYDSSGDDEKSSNIFGNEFGSGSSGDSGSGLNDFHQNGKVFSDSISQSKPVVGATKSRQEDTDLIDESLEQLLEDKQVEDKSASLDSDIDSKRNRGFHQKKASSGNEVSSGNDISERFGSGEGAATLSGFSETHSEHGSGNTVNTDEVNNMGQSKGGQFRTISIGNRFGSTISKRSLETSEEGMALLEKFFEMNSNEDDDLEDILKTEKRDAGESEVDISGNEVKIRKRSVEDLGDETLPNLSYVKRNEDKEMEDFMKDRKNMEKRDVLDADNSVRYLDDVMTHDLLTDAESQMIERITRGVKDDGNRHVNIARGEKSDDASLHVGESGGLGARYTHLDLKKRHSQSSDHVAQKHVMKSRAKSSIRINKRDSFSDLDHPIIKKHSKNIIVRETIDGIRNKRREILDNIPVKAPHIGLLQKRDLILDTDTDADIFMANAGRTKYDMKEKRFIRTDDSFGSQKSPDRRYASFISDKITDLTPLNNEYLENLKRHNAVMSKNSKPSINEKTDLPLIGTYAKPTQVSGIWSGLGSKPVFVEKDKELEDDETGSGIMSDQNAHGSGQEPVAENTRALKKASAKHFRAEEIGNIMEANGKEKKNRKDKKNIKRNENENEAKRGKRMDKEEEKRYNIDRGNSQIVLAFDEVHEILPRKKKHTEEPAKPTKKQRKTISTSKKITKKESRGKKKGSVKDWNEDSKEYDDDDFDGSGSGDEESGDEETEKHVRSEDDVTVKTLSANYRKNEEITKRDLIIVKRAPDDYGYLGCFVDVLSPVRDLSVRAGIPFVTINNCRSACKRTGYYYAGLQFGYLCFCGNTYGKYDMAPDSECNYQCSGNAQQTCGGLWRNSVYSTAGSPDDSKEGPIPIYLSPQENAPSNTTNNRRSDIPVPANASSFTSANVNSTNSYQQVFQEVQQNQGTSTPQNITGQPVNYGQQNQSETVGNKQNGGKRKVLMHFAYLHPQHGGKVEPTSPPSPTPPLRIEPQTRVFKGEIKLKQKWFDQFRDKMSTKSLILAGNVEQALRNIYTNNTKFHDFLKAEVLSFREGIINNNPDTVRKVIVEFALTFNQNAISPDTRLFATVRAKKRLDEMPVYAKSLKVSEYRFDPNSPNQAFKVPVKEPIANQSDSDDIDEKRKSFIAAPNIVDSQPQSFFEPLNSAEPTTKGIKELQNYLSAESNAPVLQNEAAAVTKSQQAPSLQQQLDSGRDSVSTENPSLSKRADVPNMEEKRRNVPYILRLFFWKDMLARKKRRTQNEGMPRIPLTRERRGDLDTTTSFEDDDDNNNDKTSKINKLNSDEKIHQPLTGERSPEKRFRVKIKRKTKDLTTEKELKRSKRTDEFESDFD